MQYRIKPHVFGLDGSYAYDITDSENMLLAKFSTDFPNQNQGEMRDLTGHVLAVIHRKMFSVHAEYDITVTGQETLVMKKPSLNPLNQSYTAEGPDVSYQLEDNWRSNDFNIRSNGAVVAQVTFERTSILSGNFLVEIADGSDISTMISLVMTMDEEQS